MKRFIVIAMMLLATNTYAESKNKAKQIDATISLKTKWDKDETLVQIGSSNAFYMYGVKGTALISEDDSNLRTAWTGFLYTKQGRHDLPLHLKKSYYCKTKWNINCNDKSTNTITSVYYDAKGGVVNSENNDGRWDETVPGSIADVIVKLVCSIDMKSESTEDVPEEAPSAPAAE